MEHILTKKSFIHITEISKSYEQAVNLVNIHWDIQKEGFKIVKHLPGSSEFKHKDGITWISYWKNHPLSKNKHTPLLCDSCFLSGKEIVGCHVYDIKTKEVFIYPACKSCNTTAIGCEDDFPFYAKQDLLIPFEVEVAVCENLSKSPRELLTEILDEL